MVIRPLTSYDYDHQKVTNNHQFRSNRLNKLFIPVKSLQNSSKFCGIVVSSPNGRYFSEIFSQSWLSFFILSLFFFIWVITKRLRSFLSFCKKTTYKAYWYLGLTRWIYVQLRKYRYEFRIHNKTILY